MDSLLDFRGKVDDLGEPAKKLLDHLLLDYGRKTGIIEEVGGTEVDFLESCYSLLEARLIHIRADLERKLFWVVPFGVPK
jgi:hypothetical protein